MRAPDRRGLWPQFQHPVTFAVVPDHTSGVTGVGRRVLVSLDLLFGVGGCAELNDIPVE